MTKDPFKDVSKDDSKHPGHVMLMMEHLGQNRNIERPKYEIYHINHKGMNFIRLDGGEER